MAKLTRESMHYTYMNDRTACMVMEKRGRLTKKEYLLDEFIWESVYRAVNLMAITYVQLSGMKIQEYGLFWCENI